MSEIITGLLILTGGGFSLIAAIGLIRFPDVLMRMHASTKAGTLGAGLSLAGAALFFGEISVVTKCVLAILFLLLTAPLAAHMIGRASLRGKHIPTKDRL